jgi:hypothetical protein
MLGQALKTMLGGSPIFGLDESANAGKQTGQALYSAACFLLEAALFVCAPPARLPSSSFKYCPV